jgi:hypothetical protein
MKRQPFLHGRPCRGHLLCHCHRHLRLRLRRRCHCRCHCCCHHHCRCNCPLPSPLPWAIAVVAVNHRCRHLCRVTVSHCCRRCPCRRTLLSPSLLAITVAIAVGHHCCHAVDHFQELLPWRSKNFIQPIKANNAYLILFCWDSGQCIDQSRITYQVLSGDGQHQRWAASGKQ